MWIACQQVNGSTFHVNLKTTCDNKDYQFYEDFFKRLNPINSWISPKIKNTLQLFYPTTFDNSKCYMNSIILSLDHYNRLWPSHKLLSWESPNTSLLAKDGQPWSLTNLSQALGQLGHLGLIKISSSLAF